MADGSKACEIDEYIAEFPEGTQEKLREIRELIRDTVPAETTETISYAIPTFDYKGRHLVHFAGFAHHVGLYPAPQAMEAFDEELQKYKRGKGSVRFDLSEPLPTELIRRIVEFRVARIDEGGN